MPPAVIRAEWSRARERLASGAPLVRPAAVGVSRRTFLQGAGAATASLVLAPDRVESAPPAAAPGRARATVAVVGAGLAGPSAAPVPHGDATAHPQVGEVAKAVLASLEPVWPGATADWTGLAALSVPARDPHVNGSSAYYRVGQYHRIGGAEAARQRNVHFAGEHTSAEHQGFMEGAAAEGVRAGRAVLADLRPPARRAPRARRG